jgi:hypothetical protein
MADERATSTGEAQVIPKGYRWSDLANPAIEGVRLEEHYRETLRKLGEAGGMLGLIFRKAQNKIQDVAPACGTGGFLLATHAYLTHHFELDRDQKKHLKFDACAGSRSWTASAASAR